MVKQFKQSVAAKGKFEVEDQKKSLRQKEIEYKCKYYMVSLAEHVDVGLAPSFDEQFDINHIRSYLKEALEKTCKKQNEVRIEIEANLTQYSQYLKWCLQQQLEKRKQQKSDKQLHKPTFNNNLLDIKL
ncbi:developmentally-regulated protein [Acrasis kona]|uniref:Developmentally-regulated protein n=1 Tax=Acrasis kona TaxID=1008807 RepID=A0AAW2YHG8_9EUKA